MTRVRQIGAACLGIAAIAIYFAMAPHSETAKGAPDYQGQIVTALADYAANNAEADSAPQQDVVNGWAAKDLLTVIANEQASALSPKSAPHDNRIPAELLLVVVGLALAIVTMGDGASGSVTPSLPRSPALQSPAAQAPPAVSPQSTSPQAAIPPVAGSWGTTALPPAE